MIRKILPIILIFNSLSVFAQKEFLKGFIILESNDTITGKLKDKKYFSANSVKLFQDDVKIRYPKKVIREIQVDSDNYVKSDRGIWTKAFFKKEESGNINLYSYKKQEYLGAYDSDLNFGRLTPSIKFYCNDYPDLIDSISKVNKYNIHKFINKYNNWKALHPDSKSYFEKNIHNKPLINFKVSFLLPGAGLEIGLSEKFSLNAMLKNEFGYGSSAGWIVTPFIDNQLRYYRNIDKRKNENKRTYKYTGDYISIVQVLFIENRSNFLGFEYGWQRIISKHWYYNVGLGAAKWTTGNKSLTFLYDIDFGYNF